MNDKSIVRACIPLTDDHQQILDVDQAIRVDVCMTDTTASIVPKDFQKVLDID